jgi:hypothetical protein
MDAEEDTDELESETIGYFVHQGHQPTFVSVDQEILRRSLEAVELGLEHTRTSLAEYDDTHGRAILRHRQWCETLEQHAAKLLRSRGEIRTSLGFQE